MRLWFTLGLVATALVLLSATSAQNVQQIPLAGVSSISGSSTANTGAVQGPEYDSAVIGDDTDGADSAPGISINRTISTGPGTPISRPGNIKAKSNPQLVLSIDALNHFEQRFVAGGGNQFFIEPPDQGLCVGNGFVLETLNDVLQIFDTSGIPSQIRPISIVSTVTARPSIGAKILCNLGLRSPIPAVISMLRHNAGFMSSSLWIAP